MSSRSGLVDSAVASVALRGDVSDEFKGVFLVVTGTLFLRAWALWWFLTSWGDEGEGELCCNSELAKWGLGSMRMPRCRRSL